MVLLDEVGAGTDPAEGSAMAISILDYIHQIGCRIIATTHYSELKAYAYQKQGTINASMEFDIQTLSPTYRLLVGVPGRSNAFAIAERLGLSRRIIDHARMQVGEEDQRVESMIASLEENRLIAESERLAAEQLRREAEAIRKSLESQQLKFDEQRDKLLEKAERDAREAVLKARREADEVISELRRMALEEAGGVKDHRPTDTRPSLLSFNEVTTFLHEFGHALHGMLSKCTYESLSGTSVARDFVELPSQFMENFAYEKEWLAGWAIHYITGERISDELIEKIRASATFNEGYACNRQLGFAFLDMAWHTLNTPLANDISEFESAAMEKTELFPPVEGSNMSVSFGHIFGGGYAAGYYGYKWAEVLDADAFKHFREIGIFNSGTAPSFRKNILEKGGTDKPMNLYLKFRGKEPTIDAFLERSGLSNQDSLRWNSVISQGSPSCCKQEKNSCRYLHGEVAAE